MARTLHLRLGGQSEVLLNDLEKRGLNERDVMAKALWLLDLAFRTERLAILKPNVNGTTRNVDNIVQARLSLQDLFQASATTESMPESSHDSDVPSES